MEYDLKKLEKIAEKTLSSKRFYHTQCVVEQAQALARMYGCSEEKAMVAGWMHDICKEQSQNGQLQWLTKYGIILDDIQKSQPKTWHGISACGYMRSELGITDLEILDAVRYHTTARGAMTQLDEVVYLADLTSRERSYPDIEKMRALVCKGLEPAMNYAMRYALADLVARGLGISRDSFEAYNYYLKFQV